jgi:glycosyltransferase involved in cell wall biosynthesis
MCQTIIGIWKAHNMSPNTNITLAIGIPSFRRVDGLELCLQSVAKQITSINDMQIVVIVAENDLDRQGSLSLVAQMAPNYRFALHGYLSDARGISPARNALLHHGFATHGANALAMIDDDQWIEPDWVERMYHTLQAQDADVVGCKVLPDFMGVPQNWVQEHGIFQRPTPHTGLVKMISATGGVMLSSRIFNRMPRPVFDDAYSFTGGGDSEFFFRLKDAGSVFAVCAEAVAHECYPPDRQTLAYVHQRTERLSMTAMTTRLRRKNSNAFALRVFFVEVIDMALAAIAFPCTFYSGKLRQSAVRRFLRARGKMRAILGASFEMYR